MCAMRSIACLCILAVAAEAAAAEAAQAEATEREDEQLENHPEPAKPLPLDDESGAEETEDEERDEEVSELEYEPLPPEDTGTEEIEDELSYDEGSAAINDEISVAGEDEDELSDDEGSAASNDEISVAREDEDELSDDEGSTASNDEISVAGESEEEIEDMIEIGQENEEEGLVPQEEIEDMIEIGEENEEEGLVPQDLYINGDHLAPVTALQLHGIHLVIDEDQDGKVSLAEVMHFSRKLAQSVEANSTLEIPKDLDKDSDGKVSLDEVMKTMDQLDDAEHAQILRSYESLKFDVADEDNDGFLEPDELKTMWSDTHDRILHLTVQATQKLKDRDGDGQISLHEFWEPGWADVGPMLTSEESHADFELLDKDNNGTLDINELKAFKSGTWDVEKKMARLFELADEDGDAHLSVDELSAARSTGLVESGAHSHVQDWVAHLEL